MPLNPLHQSPKQRRVQAIAFASRSRPTRTLSTALIQTTLDKLGRLDVLVNCAADWKSKATRRGDRRPTCAITSKSTRSARFSARSKRALPWIGKRKAAALSPSEIGRSSDRISTTPPTSRPKGADSDFDTLPASELGMQFRRPRQLHPPRPRHASAGLTRGRTATSDPGNVGAARRPAREHRPNCAVPYRQRFHYGSVLARGWRSLDICTRSVKKVVRGQKYVDKFGRARLLPSREPRKTPRFSAVNLPRQEPALRTSTTLVENQKSEFLQNLARQEPRPPELPQLRWAWNQKSEW